MPFESHASHSLSQQSVAARKSVVEKKTVKKITYPPPADAPCVLIFCKPDVE